MKIFRFVKKVFFLGLTILSNFTKVTSLNCISIKNQECKTRPQVIDINIIILYFILLVLKYINVVAVVITLIILVTSLNCISLKNQERKTRAQVIDINIIILYFILLVS